MAKKKVNKKESKTLNALFGTKQQDDKYISRFFPKSKKKGK